MTALIAICWGLAGVMGWLMVVGRSTAVKFDVMDFVALVLCVMTGPVFLVLYLLFSEDSD